MRYHDSGLRFRFLATALALVSILTVALIIRHAQSNSFASQLDPAGIEEASGLQGEFDGQTFKAVVPRPNLSTSVNGIRMGSEFGLRAQVTITGTRHHAVLLGDIPFEEAEVSAALRTAIESGLTVTALHNRFLSDSPRILSLHVELSGPQETLSKALGKYSKGLREIRSDVHKPVQDFKVPKKSSLKLAEMESLLWKGTLENGIFRVSVGRGTLIDGLTLGEPTGVSSWAAFMGDHDRAIVNGEIATLEFELPYVIRDLMDADIQIVSIHTHMTREKPKLVFVHFWGAGTAANLAAGVKAAIWEKEHFQSQ